MNCFEDSLERIQLLRHAARETSFTIDYLDLLTSGLSRQAALKVIGNASSMPSNMKSMDNPYTCRSFLAPTTEAHCVPSSQLES